MHTINWENVKSSSHISDRRPFYRGGSPEHYLDALRLVARNQYAWPGGYELTIITADGGTICGDCVRKEYELMYRATAAKDSRSGWMAACHGAIGADIDPSEMITCDHCGRVICGGDDE